MPNKFFKIKKYFFVLSTISLLFFASCRAQENKSPELKKNISDAKVTFIELGSVNCIPCRKMQPIMKNIEKKYNGKVNVIFYDVWKPDQKKYAEQYQIKLIPTQIFLDENKKEFFRHEGYFPEAEIVKLLKNHGIN